MTARTYRLTQQGQIADRYTKAIEQLGSAMLDVRLGGIYALERIAVDSKRDHPTIVEVLSAFVREHSHPAHTDSKPTPIKTLNAFLEGDSQTVHGDDWPDVDAEDEDESEEVVPSADVQAAVTVLGRLPKRSDVSRGFLPGVQLANALLYEANLSGVRFVGADLSGADLHEANLSDVRLDRANLSGASLLQANLSGADLTDANLSDASLNLADLSGASLIGANLTGAGLPGANLSGTLLDWADLSEAGGLTQRQLNAADGGPMTRLPDGLQRPTSWATGEESAAGGS